MISLAHSVRQRRAPVPPIHRRDASSYSKNDDVSSLLAAAAAAAVPVVFAHFVALSPRGLPSTRSCHKRPQMD